MIDTDGDGFIDFSEFQHTLFLSPDVSPRAVFDKWERSASFDIGESLIVPGDSISLRPWQTLFCGAVAGTVSRTVTAPMDRLKVLLQAGAPGVHGVTQGLRYIYQSEGSWRAFFRGNGANVIKIAPETAIKFLVYERAKVLFAADPEHLRPHERFCAGACAGVVSQTSVYGLEVAKTKLAVSPAGTYSGILDAFRKTYHADGIRGLFRGVVPSLLGVVPYAGVDLAVYSMLREYFVPKQGTGDSTNSSPSVVTLLCCGGISSSCGQVVAYPLQLVRTKMQSAGAMEGSVHYNGMLDCFQQVLRKEGVRGLYRGIGPNFLKALPAISISYAVYEKSKDFVQTINTGKPNLAF
mmetsp:Transcript_17627/g.38268  ORF Transcript_17627/g.38268 Transcript_17627/m.38268 type:complete len:351 (+) Transcript_17627:3-1055(+)